jgi:predicted DNA-binding transcriptional regulator AlpA
MNVGLEHLQLIPQILKQLESLKLSDAMQSEKRWLNTRELSDYIGYSLDAINKMVKENVFIDGIHYHKPQKKLLFDKVEVDNWVFGIKSDKQKLNINNRVNEILQGID